MRSIPGKHAIHTSGDVTLTLAFVRWSPYNVIGMLQSSSSQAEMLRAALFQNGCDSRVSAAGIQQGQLHPNEAEAAHHWTSLLLCKSGRPWA